MLRRPVILVVALLLAFSAAHAQEILDYSVHVDVEDGMVRQRGTLLLRNNHEAPLRMITYPFSGQVKGLKTFDEIGGLESRVELRGGRSYVTTQLRESLRSGENATILYEFHDPAAISSFNNTYTLVASYPVLANVKSFSLVLMLPEGAGLLEPDVDVVPAPSLITSDGRRIILEWRASNPTDFRIFVRYAFLLPQANNETSTPVTATTLAEPPLLEQERLLLFLSALLLLIFTALLALRLMERRGIEERIDILKEDEQLILKLVAQEDGIEQREIQRRTDFSKTKVSKILAELEKRGVIRKVSTGKKNKVYLTQKLKE